MTDKKMGRPLLGDKKKSRRQEVLLDEDEFILLEKLSKRNGMSRSQYLRETFKRSYLKEMLREE